MPISENDNIRNHCSLEGYESMSKIECCGLHIHWMNEEYDKFDDYYCAILEITNWAFIKVKRKKEIL